jgi:hypothetical protein
MHPTFGNGKICYIEILATDISRSADFYQRVFGRNVRTNGEGSPGCSSVDLILATGGGVVQPIGAATPEITALFRDTAGSQHQGGR